MKHIYRSISCEAFHVHTKRCHHAGEEEDSAYVEKAILLGANRIVFTDHGPFPGDPFGNRMDMAELPEYIDAIASLKRKYIDEIEIICGLEVEYLPSFMGYYTELKDNPGINLLIIGQHFYENKDGSYSFSNEEKNEEYIGLCRAMVDGVNTELFDVVAHPDRAFRRRKSFGKEEIDAAKEVIWAATYKGVYLERNYSSMQHKRQFREEFWALLPEKAKTIYGLDAHSTDELEGGILFRTSNPFS